MTSLEDTGMVQFFIKHLEVAALLVAQQQLAASPPSHSQAPSSMAGQPRCYS